MTTVSIKIKPLSVNNAYTNPVGKRGRVSTNELRNFHKKFSTLFMSKTGRLELPIDDPVRMKIMYFFDGPFIRQNEKCAGMPVQDVTNYDKPVLDSLEGVLYEDDNQIKEIELQKFPADENKIKIYWAKV
jgi:Holliday junction resolvase RusA-like endonuclease